MGDFVVDSLDAANTVNLTSRSGATGATWQYHPSYSGSLLFNTNGVYPATNSVVAFASGIPATPEYNVSAVIRNIDDTISLGIGGRWSTTQNTGYYTYHLSNQWHLIKAENGTLTNLGSSTSYALTSNTDYNVTLQLYNTQKSVIVNGVTVITSTDNTITAAGRVAIRSGAAGTSTTGKRILSISATDTSIFASDSGTISAVEVYKKPLEDIDTISVTEAMSRTSTMALSDSGSLASSIQTAAIVQSMTRSDTDTISESARTFTMVSSFSRAVTETITTYSENISIVTSYPVLKNDLNTADIIARSGTIHYEISKHVQWPFSIRYEHSGIYNEAVLDPSLFVVVDEHQEPQLTGVAVTSWTTGETALWIDETLNEELIARFGLVPTLVG